MPSYLALSIITVCYNAASLIEQTLMSVAKQSYENFEHWIIDGASEDDTLMKVQKYSYPQLKFISQKDHGIYDAMNQGALLAKGEYLLFLNAGDHLYDKETLKNVFKNAAILKKIRKRTSLSRISKLKIRDMKKKKAKSGALYNL